MYEQLDIFDMTRPTFQIDKPIRLIELFAGVGSQAMAFRDLGANFEHYRVVEFDRFAVASYNAIHGTDFETTDIRNISGADLRICGTDKYCYIMTYSFPCQDLSVAGKQKGMTKGSGTRSGLLWEVERLLNECSELPQVLLMENVPQVHSKANMPDFQKWIDFLESKGYSNYWQDLNAKDYGVAQNRLRTFMASLLGEWNYKFPQPTPLERKLRDYLEDEVDEKYYINTEKAQKLIQQLIDDGTLENTILTDRQTDVALTEVSTIQEKEPLRTVSRQDMTVEYQTSIQTETWLLNNKRIERKTDVATCLMARDYKGFGNQLGNGVVEWKKGD